MRKEIVNPIVRNMAHSRITSFHHATRLKAEIEGTPIINILGHVTRPLGGSSR
tara:strand:+ start:2706 stop:2864 length:159 start_codon:yes stop_codon:yes gene_type:complete